MVATAAGGVPTGRSLRYSPCSKALQIDAAEGLPPLQPTAGVLQSTREAKKASVAQRMAAIMALGAGRPWWAEQLAEVRAGIMAHHRDQACQAAAAAGGGDGSASQAAVADEGGAEAVADAMLWRWWPKLGHKESKLLQLSFHGKKRQRTI
jgi:hypothetical protein